MNKQILRQINRQRLMAIPPEEKKAFDQTITASFFDLLTTLPGDIVSVYNPMPFEVDCIPLTRLLYERKKRVCFPGRLNPNHPQMVFKELSEKEYEASSKTDFFTQGVHYPIVSPDILVIPMLGFHLLGYRLGYGGGYYDTGLYNLRQQKDVKAICLGYSMVEVDQPFFESHDEKMDIIITEKQVLAIQ